MDFEEKARDPLVEEAAAWLVRLDAGTADEAAFETWRGTDPRHASVFAQVAATWKRTGELRGVAQEPPAPLPEPARPGLTRRTLLGSAAASGAAAAIGATMLLWDQRAYAETAVGERRTIRLPDGSRAELNTNTRIAWRFSERRELWIEQGEAAFVVASDLVRPFVLRAQAMRAVLDTGQYTLRLEPGRARLVTLAGRARIDDGAGSERALLPGHAATATGAALTEAALSPGEAERLAAWRRGEIIFDGMTLGAALGEFNRYLPRPLTLASRDLASVRLGGRFYSDDPQGFLSALHDGFGISSRAGDGEILLFRAGDAPSAAPKRKNLPAT